MNFTDRYISNTYNNVMVNDGFINDKPLLYKTNKEPSKILNTLNQVTPISGYSPIYDGSGLQSNLFLSVDEIGSSNWPNTKYTVNNGASAFTLPGSNLTNLAALSYELSGNNLTFVSNKLIIYDDKAQFGTTNWPFANAPENSILSIKGNNITFDTENSSKLLGKKERLVRINRSVSRSGTGESQYTINFNYGNYVDLSRAKTVMFRVQSYKTNDVTGYPLTTSIQYNFSAGELIMLPVDMKSPTFWASQSHIGGPGQTYVTAGYRTFYDSQILIVTLLGVVYLKD